MCNTFHIDIFTSLGWRHRRIYIALGNTTLLVRNFSAHRIKKKVYVDTYINRKGAWKKTPHFHLFEGKIVIFAGLLFFCIKLPVISGTEVTKIFCLTTDSRNARTDIYDSLERLGEFPDEKFGVEEFESGDNAPYFTARFYADARLSPSALPSITSISVWMFSCGPEKSEIQRQSENSGIAADERQGITVEPVPLLQEILNFLVAQLQADLPFFSIIL